MGVLSYERLPEGGTHGAEKEEGLLKGNGPCVEVGELER